MQLAGNISIGPWIEEHDTVHVLANPPTTLIYGRAETRKASAIGAFPKATSRDEGTPDFPNISGPDRCPVTFLWSEVNFSSAPLGNVAHAEVFHQEGSPYSRGLRFVYYDGSQRALGDCRMGVDPCETYKTPRTLCVFSTSDWETHVVRQLWRVQVHFTSEPLDDDDEEIIDCSFHEMKGTLRFWFDHEQSHIEIAEN